MENVEQKVPTESLGMGFKSFFQNIATKEDVNFELLKKFCGENPVVAVDAEWLLWRCVKANASEIGQRE